MDRAQRADFLYKFGVEAFGEAQMTSVPHRAIRFLEEAIELYQACGADQDMAHKLVDYVYSRPRGDIFKELGGVGVTLLILALVCGRDADNAEEYELNRLAILGPEHFKPRDAAKNEAGFKA